MQIGGKLETGRASMKSLRGVLAVVFIVHCLTVSAVRGADPVGVPMDKAIEVIKNFNFVVLTLGILSDGVPDGLTDQLSKMQTAPPRSMRIYLTQNKKLWDIYNDFTFLTNEKAVNAILIYPSAGMGDAVLIDKICQMSKRKKIPIIAMQDGWLEKGAAVVIEEASSPRIKVNEQVCQVLNFPIAERPIYQLVRQ